MRAVIVLLVVAGVAWADEPTQRAAAVAQHATAQKTNADADFQLAADAYAAYLAAFPSAPKASELRFYRAQILIHHLHRAVEGADEMMIVAASKLDQKFVLEGLLDAIDVYFAAAEDTKLAAAADKYAELSMGGPQIIGIMFKLAKRAHLRKDFHDAIPRLQAIVTKYPNDPFAGPAADLLLDSYAQLRDTEGLEATARALKSLPAYKDADHQTRLDKIAVQAMQLRAEDLAGKRDWKHSAETYQRIATEFPKSERIEETYFNAGVMFDEAGDFEAAVTALRKVYELAPTSRIAARALMRAGSIDEALHPERAAEEFIRASAIPCSDKSCREAADARFNAAVMFTAIGDNAKAAAAFATYIHDFPKSADRRSSTFQLGVISARAGDFARAEKTLQKYTTENPRDARGWLELGRAARKLDHRDISENAFGLARVVAAQDMNTAVTAEALFESAELVRHDLDKSKISAERDVLILNVEAFYTRIEALGDPFWTVAALDASAHVDESAKSADARAQAIATYRAAIAKADELGVVGQYVIDARAQLERLEPAEFKPAHEAREGFRDHSFWPDPIDHR